MFPVLIMNNPRLKASNTKKLIQGGIIPASLIEDLRMSAPYVNGRIYDNGLINAGRLLIGINSPQRNIIGNRKKFEKVCASKTSLTDTAINRPRKVDVTAIKNTPKIIDSQFIPERSTTNEAKRTGINALMIPKRIAPVVFANISKFRLTGASKRRSNERLFLSKVIVTESMEVVPNKMDSAITPGSMPLMSTALSDLTKNMSVHDNGKIMPQLMFGGFR